MPPRIPSPCCAPHCRNLATSRYCTEHKHLGWENHQAGRTRHQRGYGTNWDKIKARIIKRDSYLCQPHKRAGYIIPATEVDHIIPKAHGGTDADSNLEGTCNACHKTKTATERLKKPIKNEQNNSF